MDDSILSDDLIVDPVLDSEPSAIIDYSTYLQLIDDHIIQVDNSLNKLHTVSILILVVCSVLLFFKGVFK